MTLSLGMLAVAEGFVSPSILGVARSTAVQLTRSPFLPMMASSIEDCGCGTAADPLFVNGISVTADKLRSLTLVNSKGERVTVGSQIGDGKSVVVFLRHLG
eukprot:6177898-Pleurochrysis_carterae.AAC.3